MVLRRLRACDRLEICAVIRSSRVLEIPTPRWTTIQAAQLGIAPPDVTAATIQERAWSSPIWYAPTAEAHCVLVDSEGVAIYVGDIVYRVMAETIGVPRNPWK